MGVEIASALKGPRFIQQSKERPLLQASDYVLWAIQRAYEKGDFRYYNYLREKGLSCLRYNSTK